jgi:hypothetical protein
LLRDCNALQLGDAIAQHLKEGFRVDGSGDIEGFGVLAGVVPIDDGAA